MRALSLWQPWASLIYDGRKTIETRSWEMLYRGPAPAVGGPNLVTVICVDGTVYYQNHTRACTDKRRVLLMSEDGKWHCYDFSRMEK